MYERGDFAMKFVRDIYADVLRLTDMTEGRFCHFYNMAVSELCSEYGERFVLRPFEISHDSDCKEDCKEKHFELRESVKTANDEAINYPEYDGAIVNNILFLDDMGKTINKEMSISQGKSAYQLVWKKLRTVKTAKARPWL